MARTRTTAITAANIFLFSDQTFPFCHLILFVQISALTFSVAHLLTVDFCFHNRTELLFHQEKLLYVQFWISYVLFCKPILHSHTVFWSAAKEGRFFSFSLRYRSYSIYCAASSASICVSSFRRVPAKGSHNGASWNA